MVSRRTLILTLLTGAVVFRVTGMVYQFRRDVVVDFENAFEGGFISDFHARERVGEGYFRWTRNVSYLDFRHLPVDGELPVEARIRVRRPHGESMPNLAFTANGATVHTTQGLPGTVTYHFTVPATEAHVRLGIRSDTFDPSGERPLGVQVLGVTVRVPEGKTPSWLVPSLQVGAAAVLLFAAGLVAWGKSVPATLAALLSSGVFIFLLAQHSVRFTSYPRDVVLLAGATLGVTWLTRRLQKDPRGAVTSAIAVVFLVEMAVVFYPLTVSSDAHFQANRMEHFLEGDWHPTSVTQHADPFEIPYPVSLYAATAPVVTLGIERMPALAFMTALFDVMVSIALIVLAVRFLDDLRGGVLAALLYQLVPMNALTFSAGNFTNLFAVSMLTLSFLFLFTRPWVSAFFTFVALTAHFGMLVEGVVLWPTWLAVAWLGPVPVDDQRRRLTLAVGMSFLAAGLYYLGYRDLVTGQWHRAFEGGAGAGKGGFEAAMAQLGWVFAAVAALGALSLLKRPFSPSFRNGALVWLAVTGVFLAIDLVSAIEIRYVLQALPLLALLGGFYVSNALERGRAGRAAAWGVMLYVVVVGFRTLYEVVLVRYH